MTFRQQAISVPIVATAEQQLCAIPRQVIFFMLETLGAVTEVSNLHIYAAMRGETLEAFQRTRNAPAALYSVAGKGAGNLGWDQQTGAASHS